MDTSSSTDSLSDNSAPMLITEDNGIPSMLEATRSQEDRLCQNPQGCCISVATGILSSMHVESSSCTHAQGSGRHPQLSRAADAILSMNQAALRAVVSVVQCSCYRRPQVLPIVTVICSEITAWYRHIVELYSHGRNSTAGRAVLPSSKGKVEIRRPDFFIGDHCLGKDLGTALIRQILSGMLQELQAVIEDIACHAGQSAAVNEPRSDLMLGSVQARMVAFLRTQLRALTSALDNSKSDSATVHV